MSLLNALLENKNIDLEKPQTKKIKSPRLKAILGSEEDVYIEVRELSAKRVTELMNMQYDKKGNFDLNRNLTAKALIAVDGVVDPPLTDKGLIEHFKCNTPKELATKMFSLELTKISDTICELSGMTNDEDEAEEENEELKNS